MSKEKRAYTKIIIAIIVLILIDQIIKVAVINIGDKTIIPEILNFSISRNVGGTYGVSSNSAVTYVFTNLIVVAIAFKFITSQNQFIDKKIKVFLTLVIAGGLSNCIDRIFRGYVVEFIQIMKLPIFNFADICILIGWVSMVAIFASFSAKELKNRKRK